MDLELDNTRLGKKKMWLRGDVRYPGTDITNPGHGLVSQSRTWIGSITPDTSLRL